MYEVLYSLMLKLSIKILLVLLLLLPYVVSLLLSLMGIAEFQNSEIIGKLYLISRVLLLEAIRDYSHAKIYDLSELY